MSSIYKKGRDGYFYYQTYILNEETGKKDKKIFHSLGTKDAKIAQEKKVLLDSKYDNINKKEDSQKIRKDKKLFLYPIILLVMTFLFLNNYDAPFFKKNPSLPDSQSPPNALNDEIIIASAVNESSKVLSIKNEDQNNNFRSDTIVIKKNNLRSIKIDQQEIKIPKYEIIRIERLPNSFNQIKVYATIDSITASDGMLLLCDKIKEEYIEFTSIIICLYANNKDGIEMATNNNAKISKYLKKKNWLAMYTYNPVEGEYFDDNPGLYLGLY